MVLCHGPGGIPTQKTVKERGVSTIDGFILGVLLGAKNSVLVFLSTLSTMRHYYAVVMCVVTTYTNMVCKRWACSNCAFVA